MHSLDPLYDASNVSAGSENAGQFWRRVSAKNSFDTNLNPEDILRYLAKAGVARLLQQGQRAESLKLCNIVQYLLDAKILPPQVISATLGGVLQGLKEVDSYELFKQSSELTQWGELPVDFVQKWQDITAAMAEVTIATKGYCIKDMVPGFRLIGTQNKLSPYNEVFSTHKQELQSGARLYHSVLVGSLPSFADIEDLIKTELAKRVACPPTANNPMLLVVHCCQEEGEQVMPGSGVPITKYGRGDDRDIFTDVNSYFKQKLQDLQERHSNVKIVFKRVCPGGLRDGGMTKVYDNQEITPEEFLQYFKDLRETYPSGKQHQVHLYHCFGGVGRSASYAIGHIMSMLTEGAINLSAAVDLVGKKRGTGKGLEKYRLAQRHLLANAFALFMSDVALCGARKFAEKDIGLLLQFADSKYLDLLQLKRHDFTVGMHEYLSDVNMVFCHKFIALSLDDKKNYAAIYARFIASGKIGYDEISPDHIMRVLKFCDDFALIKQMLVYLKEYEKGRIYMPNGSVYAKLASVWEARIVEQNKLIQTSSSGSAATFFADNDLQRRRKSLTDELQVMREISDKFTAVPTAIAPQPTAPSQSP